MKDICEKAQSGKCDGWLKTNIKCSWAEPFEHCDMIHPACAKERKYISPVRIEPPSGGKEADNGN